MSAGHFGEPLQHFASIGSTNEEAYTRYVSTECIHNWYSTSHGWTQGYAGLLGGGVGCGDGPLILYKTDEQQLLSPIKRLHNRARAVKLLKALSPGTFTVSSNELHILRAIHELNDMTTQAEEDEWWNRYHRLLKIG